METEEFEKRVMRLQRLGIMTKYTASDIVCAYAQDETRREAILSSLKKIESLNDEDGEFFIKLNQLINTIIYG